MLSYIATIGSILGIYLLLTLATNLQYGFAGLVNFGIVGFFATGAYVSALLTTTETVPIVFGVLAASTLGFVFAIAISFVCINLKSDYLGIVTLSFGEILRLFILSEEWLTQGARGIANIPLIRFGAVAGGVDWSFTIIILAINAIVAIFLGALLKSPYGRSIRALRDDEVAFEAVGKDPSNFKRVVFATGSALMAGGGALYAHYIGYVSPDQFMPLTTFYVWIAMIMGGAGKMKGALVGTILLTVLLEGSRFLRDLIPFISEVEMASIRLAAVGLALMIVAAAKPKGLMGDFTSK